MYTGFLREGGFRVVECGMVLVEVVCFLNKYGFPLLQGKKLFKTTWTRWITEGENIFLWVFLWLRGCDYFRWVVFFFGAVAVLRKNPGKVIDVFSLFQKNWKLRRDRFDCICLLFSLWSWLDGQYGWLSFCASLISSYLNSVVRLNRLTRNNVRCI